MTLPDPGTLTLRQKQALAVMSEREIERRLCESHPAELLGRVNCTDATTGERFRFQMTDPGDAWFWQRELLDWMIANEKTIVLKARQLGITWLAAGWALWVGLYKPGSKVLAVSIKESDSIKLVNRVWDMAESLPEHLRNEAEVIKPTRGSRPQAEIQWQFPDGRVSSVEGLPSTPAAGHGTTAALVILDEYSRQEYASPTWKAVLPTTQGGGSVAVISTGNGVSNDRGGGNFFHHLWVNADEMGLARRFLPWNLHPERDEDWYRRHAMALPAYDRGEQYPRTVDEAFILTGRPFFDREALAWYEGNAVRDPLYRFDFEPVDIGSARARHSDQGLIRVYQQPKQDARYAVGVDTSTGRGTDSSAAYVISLADMALAAEFHGKIDADLYATQLHYLGRMYGTALLAIETAGGYGEAVSIALRDGKAGRPPYPKIYRHVLSNRPDRPVVRVYGFPMNVKTRPLAIGQLERAVRDRLLPWLTPRLLAEMSTFVHADTSPSPRAQDGCNDDCVMAAAITLEMYRQRGDHAAADAAKSGRRRRPSRKQRDDSWRPSYARGS